MSGTSTPPVPHHQRSAQADRGGLGSDGFLVLLATPHEDFRCELADCVRHSRGGVLAKLHRSLLAPAPVIAVMPRRGVDGTLGVPVWLGPLHDPGDRTRVLDWLSAGGPLVSPLPRQLRRRIIGAGLGACQKPST
jgi:hypothetical protein